jgi:hypothetical protein
MNLLNVILSEAKLQHSGGAPRRQASIDLWSANFPWNNNQRSFAPLKMTTLGKVEKRIALVRVCAN